MNIVVFGGGEPGKFGNDFCNLARSQGHNVFILSHRDYATGDPQHAHVDCNDRHLVVKALNRLTQSIDHIDIFVYNGRMDGYPSEPQNFTSNAMVSTQAWNNNLYITVILAHVLSVEVLKKMSAGSKIVFLTTRMALEFERTEYTEYAGYAGIKAAQTHLMISLAHHNDRGAFVSSVSPHFQYDNRPKYEVVFRRVYDYILEFDQTQNGKIKVIQ
jgi:NAD(P)-dependent dehydrogenase (short-subunit alcohol dehydrogenase family)